MMNPVMRSLMMILIIVVLLSPIFAFGQVTTYEFFRNDVNPRAAALGGSFITSQDDPNAIFYNPAGLTTLTSKRLSVGFFKHLLDINAGYASFGMEVENFGHVGAGIVYVNYGNFKRTGEEGQYLGDFGAGEFALTAGYAGYLQPRLSYGVNAKLIYSSIAEVSSSAAALDFGMEYVAIPDRFIVAASILNFGTQIDPYGTTREKLPLDFKIGFSVMPEHLPAIVMVDWHKLNQKMDNLFDRFKQFSVGVEFTASPNVQLRLGYNNEDRRELKIEDSAGLAGFSIGAGFLSDKYLIDYAFSSLGRIGSLHRISVGFKF
jgi:hypothetical protein